jgi:hypothetical protein
VQFSLLPEQLRAISSGKAAHVKACHAMRGALELLDFEDASINDMKRMLLQVRCSTAASNSSHSADTSYSCAFHKVQQDSANYACLLVALGVIDTARVSVRMHYQLQEKCATEVYLVLLACSFPLSCAAVGCHLPGVCQPP